MDCLLETKLENIQDIILHYLFDNDQELINNWKNNEKIKITKNFKSLLQGDWSKDWRNKNKNINLDELLNCKISKMDFFQILVDELNRDKKDKGDYISNFNPNLFFLFFNDFYNLKIKNIKLIFEADIDINEIIIGINFNNYDKISKVIRPETLKIIELHSRFLLNNTILEILKNDLFVYYFIKNCFIQYEVKTNNSTNKFVDLCYLINENELILEINEPWHDKINDYHRELSILLSTGSRLINLDLNNYFATNEKIFDKLFFNFCKLLYQNEQSKAVILILVEINQFPLEQVELGIGLINKEIKLKLSEFLNIPFLKEINLDIDKIIEKVYEDENIDVNLDFKNFNKKFTLKNLKKYKDDVFLTSHGIKNFLLSLNGKDWKKRKEYIKFMDDLEYKYYETIKKLLEDNALDILKEENNQLKNLLLINKYDQDEFFNKIRLNRNEKLYHPRIPFIIKQDNSFVDYKLISQILKNISNKEYDIRNNIIPNYRLMNNDEINELYSEQFL